MSKHQESEARLQDIQVSEMWFFDTLGVCCGMVVLGCRHYDQQVTGLEVISSIELLNL